MTPSSRSRWIRHSSRPFILSTLILTLLATYSLFVRQPAIYSPRDAGGALRARSFDAPECREVHQASDKCAFVQTYCAEDEAGLLDYLTFYYCTPGHARPAAFTLLVVWLGLLFSTIGIAASDFFSVNLSTIASVLGLSESLAGVTFLAFGNGSPDVFSTFAAMGSNSGSMAVGELIGAAGFITAVVAGSMALVREFKVSRRAFVRDILFFIVAISFTMVFLADSRLHLWECMCMIAFYLFYVVVVVGWHWWVTRTRRRRMRLVASHGHFNATADPTSDELEPYHDDVVDDEPAPVGSRPDVSEIVDITALERGPRIEIEGVGMTPPSPEEEDEEEVGRQVAAEMTSSMRVNRPRWGRSNTTITPIRPSLVGALEFRSILSSLQKARNMHMSPLPSRAYSENVSPQPGSLEHSHASLPDHVQSDPPAPAAPPATRDRALSHGNSPLNLENLSLPRPSVEPPLHAHGHSDTHFPATNTSIDGKLAPPIRPSDLILQQQGASQKSPRLQVLIPARSPGSSGQSSPSLSPFPGLSESPALITPTPGGHSSAFAFAGPSESRHSFPGFDDEDETPKPVKWWPYQLLPAPHILYGTLFPTLQGWGEKTIWDKVVSLISVPSILILVTTLPVVESERGDEDGEVTVADPPTPGSRGRAVPPISVEPAEFTVPDAAWQEYRRRTRSNTSRTRSTLTASPVLVAIDVDAPQPTEAGPAGTLPASLPTVRKPSPMSAMTSSQVVLDPPSISVEEEIGWNRWLVAVQLFTGPVFVIFILWANMQEGMDHPAKTLLRMVLCSLVASLCLLAVLLLTTTASKKPKYHFVLCFLGFIISVAWISTVAGEVVGVLKAFGIILGISEAILGLTIFAVGNSLGDLVADVTVARLGYPVMAL